MINKENSLGLIKHPKVALLIETSNEYARGIIRGIHEYIKRHTRWIIYLGEYSRGEPKPDWLLSWKGDGIIARIENQDMANLIVKCGLPVVDISAANLIPGIPWVETDDQAISNLAVDHLIECGFRRFGFVETYYNWSKWRGKYFEAALNQKGFQCHYLNMSRKSKLTWEDEQKEIESWLIEIPKPIGIFASFDLMARQIIESCNKLGFMVPEDIAVLGVDNDPFICELCSPPLSSIIPNTQKTGYRAASLLEKMILNNDVDKLEHRIKPIGIKNRRSTDTIAIEDRYISKSIHYIYENAQSGAINIKDILSFVPMSRRVFEKTFENIVGRTPYKEMQRVRVNRIKELLNDSALTLQDIAERAGFEHVSYMSYLFKRETGITPAQYRNNIE
jgi:LacI family transcriptional regulator